MKDRKPQIIAIGLVLVLLMLVCMLGSMQGGMVGTGDTVPVAVRGGMRAMIPASVLLPCILTGGLLALLVIPDPASERQVGGVLLILLGAVVASIAASLSTGLESVIVALPFLLGGLWLLYQSLGVH